VETLRAAAQTGAEGLAACRPGLLAQTLAEHNEAVSLGITGVPALRVAGTDAW
jgi:hypothetical protein